jgi:hypothetical protein
MLEVLRRYGSAILALVGVGVKFMPNIQSWLWSEIIWGLALAWLIWAVISHRRGKKRGKQQIAIKPFVGRRHANWDKTEHFMWAELQVTNIGSAELKDVQVNITKCLALQQTQNSPNQDNFTMFEFPKLAPFCVYWSERQSQPKQMTLGIPSGATRSALIAFQDNSNGGCFNFNTVNYNWIAGGSKIDIEASSYETVLWRGEFYIECHPNYLGGDRAKFEFVEWGMWIEGKRISLIDQQSLQSSKYD